jgi:bifunctional non-homologous end joining protein LigD
VCAFSTRARAGAPVSTPLGWDELKSELCADAFTVSSLPGRLASLSRDPWENYAEVRQAITQRISSRLGVM